MKEAIEINAAIFPKIMTMVLGKPIDKSKNEDIALKDLTISEPDLIIDLPRSAHVVYLQKIAAEHNDLELRLLKQYAYGQTFTDEDYSNLLDLILKPINRSWTQTISTNDVLSPFGLCIVKDEDNNRKLELIEDAIPTIQVEAWECIIIDMLKKSALEVVSCFDFNKHFTREQRHDSEDEKLGFSLNAWKFSADVAEQKLSNALRSAFMFTLVSYKYGDLKEQYNSFQDYFELEFYKRVSLVYGVWAARQSEDDIEYIPLYESFYNLDGFQKDDLTRIMCAILDNKDIAIDERQILRNRLIEGIGEFHSNKPQNDALEETLLKPSIGYVLLREKAKETLESAKLLYDNGQYNDCANRCYYAMMNALKSLLEHQGKLPEWKPGELKGRESHDSLEKDLDEMVSEGILNNTDKANFQFVKDKRWKCDYSLFVFQKADADTCVKKTESFLTRIENITK